MNLFFSTVLLLLCLFVLVAPGVGIVIGLTHWSVNNDLPAWVGVPVAMLGLIVYIAALVSLGVYVGWVQP